MAKPPKGKADKIQVLLKANVEGVGKANQVIQVRKELFVYLSILRCQRCVCIHLFRYHKVCRRNPMAAQSNLEKKQPN